VTFLPDALSVMVTDFSERALLAICDPRSISY
jgi:hypothetical protein